MRFKLAVETVNGYIVHPDIICECLPIHALPVSPDRMPVFPPLPYPVMCERQRCIEQAREIDFLVQRVRGEDGGKEAPLQLDEVFEMDLGQFLQAEREVFVRFGIARVLRGEQGQCQVVDAALDEVREPVQGHHPVEDHERGHVGDGRTRPFGYLSVDNLPRQPAVIRVGHGVPFRPVEPPPVQRRLDLVRVEELAQHHHAAREVEPAGSVGRLLHVPSDVRLQGPPAFCL